MRATVIATLLTSLLLAAGTVAAEEKLDAKARAEAVAPFVDEATVAVVHADVSRVDTKRFVPLAVELIPGFRTHNREEKAEAIAQINAVLAAFARAGCHDLYLVVSLREPSYPALVVPLPEGSDQAGLKAMLGDAVWLGTECMHGSFCSATPAMLDQFKRSPPEPRPELAPAFTAAGATAAQILILPPKYINRVMEELLPTLPDSLGGGPSTVLTRGLTWVALGVNPSPPTSLEMVVQSEDAKAAATMTQDKQLRAILPDCEKLARLLEPKARADRLTVAVDQQGTAALLDALEALASHTPADDSRSPSKGNGN